MSEARSWVMHLDMDCFFVSVERLLDPGLIGKPVIVGGAGGRGVVCSASYEARAFGVRSAMPTGMALRRCPQAVVVPPRQGVYGSWSGRVRELLEDFSPDVIPRSIDEFACDLSGCERLHGDLLEAAIALKGRIADELGLPCTLGLASNCAVAKIAADQAKPDGAARVPFGGEAAYLAPLPVGVISGVGPKLRERLEKIGVRQIGQLLTLGPDYLERAFGSHGARLYRRALGEGPAFGDLRREGGRKSISSETTFDSDIRCDATLRRTLSQLCESVCRQLRAGGWRAGNVAIKVRHADFRTLTRSRSLPPTDRDAPLYAMVETLWDELTGGHPPAIRLLGVRFAKLQRDAGQADLFDEEDDEAQRRLLRAVDGLRARHGGKSLRFARSLEERDS